MGRENTFFKQAMKITIPVTLQSLLQSSFSVIDQVMTGQLGSTSIAGIGLGGKFSSIYSVLISAVAAVAGIMIAQYLGKKDYKEVSRSFFLNGFVALGIAVIFTVLCRAFSQNIMGMYTQDVLTKKVAAEYLKTIAAVYVPMAVTALLSTLLRCMDMAVIPLVTSIFSAIINTALNYILIFGKLGFPQMGVKGAALATVFSQCAGGLLLLVLAIRLGKKKQVLSPVRFSFKKMGNAGYLAILLPILACELFWSLGENVYAVIYGHLGTLPLAAITLTIPVQVLVMGALSGLAQASGILIGKSLGKGDYEKAYKDSKTFMWYGFVASIALSALLVALSGAYVRIYNVEKTVQALAQNILFAFAIISPVKVQNMILGGGILRSGGKTGYIMAIDFIGTWIFGVPLGFLAAFYWGLPIHYVYFILSLEECIRLAISIWVFRRGVWMKSLETCANTQC